MTRDRTRETMHDDTPDDPSDVFALIGRSLAPMAPPADVRRRVLDRVHRQMAAEAPAACPPARTLRADEGEWSVLAPAASVRVLSDDGVFRSLLVRLAAGASLPPHAHTGDEECYVVDGDVWLSGVHLFRGDFQLAGPAHDHVDIHSDGGCLLHIRTRVEASPA